MLRPFELGETLAGLSTCHGFQRSNQIVVNTIRLFLLLIDRNDDQLDAVDRLEDERDRVTCNGDPVTKLPDDSFGGMRKRFKTRKPQKPAGSLDSVHEPENLGKNGPIVRILLKANKFAVDHINRFGGLDYKIPEDIVHTPDSSHRPRTKGRNVTLARKR
jgi:hypothetical protein